MASFLTIKPARRLRSAVVLYLALAVAVIFAGSFAVAWITDSPDLAVALAIPFLAAVAFVLFVLPVQVLPALALGTLAFVPTRFVPNDGPFRAVPALAILMGIWVFRRVVLGQRPTTSSADAVHDPRMAPRLAVYTAAAVFFLWLTFSALEAGQENSISWVMSFTTSALLPLLVFDAREEARLLRKLILIAGALVGLYALGEMVLGFSPLYGAGADFEFSVYRARAAFNHPLFAGAFLTIPAAIGIGTWLMSGSRRALVCGVLASAGVVATVSRGSIAAIATAIGFAVVIGPALRGAITVKRWVSLVGISAVASVVVLNVGPLADRANSIESEISAEVRERAIGIAISAGQYSGWFGTGPATSGSTSRLFDSIIIENSLLQLLISIGIPGLIFFLLLIAALVWHALANRDLGVAMAIVAYIVSITGFNSLDAVRNMHVIIGFLVLLALNSRQPAAANQMSPDLFSHDRVDLRLPSFFSRHAQTTPAFRNDPPPVAATTRVAAPTP